MKKITLLFTMLLCAICASAATVTDVITADDLAATETTYVNFSNVTKSSGAVYLGCTAKKSSGAIQMTDGAKNNYYAGIATSVSGGFVRKITIDWESGTTSGRTLNVIGSHNPFTNTGKTYLNQGTKLGTIVCGTSTELSITEDYEYIALASSKSAMYINSITIEWEVPDPTKCAAPKFIPETGSTIWCQQDEDSEVALNCATEGAEIYYYVYGDDTDIATIPDYYYTHYDSESKVRINQNANKIAAFAKCGTLDNSEKVYGSWTIKNYVQVYNIEEFLTKGAENQNDYYQFGATSLYVTAQSTDGKYTYVRDYTGNALLVYGELTYNGTALTSLTNGQTIANIAGNYADYNGTKELTNPKVLKEVSDGDKDTDYTKPIIKSIADITANDVCQYVRINGATLSSPSSNKGTITVGDNTLNYYAGRFNPTLPEDLTKQYAVDGIIELYKNEVQLCITSVSELPNELTAQAGYETTTTLTKQEGSAVYTGTMAIGMNEAFSITDADGNTFYLADDNYHKLGKACQLTTNTDFIPRFFWSGDYTVTYNAADNTVVFDSDNAYPAQLRVIRTYKGEEAFDCTNKAYIADKKDGTKGIYEFADVEFYTPGKFYITAEAKSTYGDEVEKWAIGAADVENGNNVLATDGTVNLYPWGAANIESRPIQIKTEESGYVQANYSLIVDLTELTITSKLLTGIEDIEADGAEVAVGEGKISVAGGKATIYNAAGQTIATAHDSQVAVPAGLYIVKVNGKATKVIVK